jgi:hypothetical protein
MVLGFGAWVIFCHMVVYSIRFGSVWVVEKSSSSVREVYLSCSSIVLED